MISESRILKFLDPEITKKDQYVGPEIDVYWGFMALSYLSLSFMIPLFESIIKLTNQIKGETLYFKLNHMK